MHVSHNMSQKCIFGLSFLGRGSHLRACHASCVGHMLLCITADNFPTAAATLAIAVYIVVYIANRAACANSVVIYVRIFSCLDFCLRHAAHAQRADVIYKSTPLINWLRLLLVLLIVLLVRRVLCTCMGRQHVLKGKKVFNKRFRSGWDLR